jgi:hypothetical protein
MHLKKTLLFFTLLFTVINAIAQRYTISGTIRLKSTGETVIGATIEDIKNKQFSVSNSYGFYSISLPSGQVRIAVSYTGTKSDTFSVYLSSDIQKDFALENFPEKLDEVVVNLSPGKKMVRSTLVGVEQLSAKDINSIPQLLGERDPLKAIQLLPGIKPAGEGSSGIYVRGGAGDQNLILLDEAVVYNASHLLGFFSTFNPDVIKDVTVYKAGMPAQYGDRLSSVVDVRMNDGNNQQFSMSGGIGIISSRLNIEGPLQKNVSSFLISGRSTYIDPFLKLSGDSSINRNKIGFYDLNTKVNYSLGKRDQLFLSGYFGNDHLAAGDEIGLRWGNSTGTLRWNHIFNNRVFSNTSLIYSNFDYRINIHLDANQLNIFSRIRDARLKQEWQWSNTNHKFRTGFDIVHHTINPGDITTSANSNFNDIKYEKRYSLENAAFFSDEWKLTPTLSLNYGLRVETFSILGKGNFFNLDSSGKILDTIAVQAGHVLKTYFDLEPRLSMRFMLNSESSVKASFDRNTQNLHLLSNSTASRPTDRWVSSTNNIKPETANQVSLGYYRDFSSLYEFSVETYYKSMAHQIDYRDGADLDKEKNLETQLLYGIGKAYGIEFLIRKRSGKLSGWISYTLSKSEKKIDGINNNQWYNARQDRTHDIAVVTSLKTPRNWSLSATWVFYTGDAISLPDAKYTVNNSVYYYYSKRNGYRMPDYHRLDISATKTFKKRKRFTSELTFGVYNTYGRENAYTISFETSKEDHQTTEAIKTALFRFVPSVSYNFKF